ncbi:MAG: 50S ribosomal protein L10 [Leptospiraceae bacterium]|nr:MAG: 50S ribosomal protein L10 [Leptospiraceae bacterium]
MPSKRNIQLLEEINKILDEKPNIVMTTYTGLTVEQLTELRNKIREKNGTLKVVKNNLFKIALKNSGKHEFEEKSKEIEKTIVGPIAVAFAGEELPAIAKILVEESKKEEKIQLKGGYFEGKFFDQKEIKNLAGLPTKEELLTIIARGLNTPAQKIAIGINEIMAKLARGIKAVAEKNNKT